VSLMRAVSSHGTFCRQCRAYFEPGYTHKSLERVREHGRDVSSLDVGGAEALGPSNELSVVDPLLATWVRELHVSVCAAIGCGITHGETKRELGVLVRSTQADSDEAVQALRAEVEPGA